MRGNKGQQPPAIYTVAGSQQNDGYKKTVEPHHKAGSNAMNESNKIYAHFSSAEHDRLMGLLGRGHDTIGRLLKCHLVLEHYLDRFLTEKMGLTNLYNARLSFIQKAHLIPDDDPISDVLKPGIIQLNTIRNRFSHNLDAEIKGKDLCDFDALLRHAAGPGQKMDSPIDRIEAFTEICCSCLTNSPLKIQILSNNAFAVGAKSKKPSE